jgi:hypothetical protein
MPNRRECALAVTTGTEISMQNGYSEAAAFQGKSRHTPAVRILLRRWYGSKLVDVVLRLAKTPGQATRIRVLIFQKEFTSGISL